MVRSPARNGQEDCIDGCGCLKEKSAKPGSQALPLLDVWCTEFTTVGAIVFPRRGTTTILPRSFVLAATHHRIPEMHRELVRLCIFFSRCLDVYRFSLRLRPNLRNPLSEEEKVNHSLLPRTRRLRKERDGAAKRSGPGFLNTATLPGFRAKMTSLCEPQIKHRPADADDTGRFFGLLH
jgi:hypothetical protein